MKEIIEPPFIQEFCRLTTNMYRLGWNERNAGNISCILDEEFVKEYLDTSEVIRVMPTNFDAKALAGKYFLMTGTGKYFKNIETDPAANIGIMRISADGQFTELLWGLNDGGRFTSELPAHLMSHAARLRIDPNHRIILHAHPTNIMAMTFVHTLEENEFTHTLWQMCTESIIVFPDGVGVLPWMVCGTVGIGEATAAKFETYRAVVWAMHGMYGSGASLDEAFGLVETIEKAAEIYLKIAPLNRLNTIADEQLKCLAESFRLTPKKGIID